MYWIKSFSLTFVVLATVIGTDAFFTRKVPSPVVQLKDGKVQGIEMKSRGGRGFYGYLGIPFARPPIGQLRFMSPEPPDPWDGILDASSQRKMCPQLDFIITGLNLAHFGSEDCLYLNVFSPRDVPNGKQVPVMVHIHGGYFHCGGTVLNAPYNFMDHDVIIVDIAYRVGALGFLNSGDGVIRGNMGLRDQHLALKWVHQNIQAFGGDPARVTLLGESAGAASVQYQQLYPGSKGLFSRVIRQSGSSLNYWTLYRNSKAQAKRFAAKFNCPNEESKQMLKCLQAVDVYELVEGHRDLLNHPNNLVDKFVPSMEVTKDSDAFLTEEPLELIKSGRFTKVPVLSGMTEDDGLLHSAVLWANSTKLNGVEDWYTWAPGALHYPPDQRSISQKLRDFYFGLNATRINSPRFFQNVTNIFSDRLFNVGIVESAKLELKQGVPTFLYLYGYKGGFTMGSAYAASQSKINALFAILADRLKFIWATWILGKEHISDVPGVAHGDDFLLLWGGRLLENVFLLTKKDTDFSKDLVKLWVDFASQEMPLRFREVDFTPSLENGTLKFLHLNAKHPEMIDQPFSDRQTFWETLSLPSE